MWTGDTWANSWKKLTDAPIIKEEFVVPHLTIKFGTIENLWKGTWQQDFDFYVILQLWKISYTNEFLCSESPLVKISNCTPGPSPLIDFSVIYLSEVTVSGTLPLFKRLVKSNYVLKYHKQQILVIQPLHCPLKTSCRILLTTFRTLIVGKNASWSLTKSFSIPFKYLMTINKKVI